MLLEQLPLILVGLLAGLALLLGLRSLQVNSRLRRELSDLRRQLENRPAEKPVPPPGFSASLDQVERRQSTTTANPRSSTEKYRYVASMAAQGMDAPGIAAALQMAPAEVEQLLQLARLRQQ